MEFNLGHISLTPKSAKNQNNFKIIIPRLQMLKTGRFISMFAIPFTVAYYIHHTYNTLHVSLKIIFSCILLFTILLERGLYFHQSGVVVSCFFSIWNFKNGNEHTLIVEDIKQLDDDKKKALKQRTSEKERSESVRAISNCLRIRLRETVKIISSDLVIKKFAKLQKISYEKFTGLKANSIKISIY